MAISKIILNGVTQIDLTGDTVETSNLLQNYTAHKNDGTQVTGTATSGNIFLITLTLNQSGSFIPDCTFAEYKAAYQAGKDISIQSDVGIGVGAQDYQSDYIFCELYEWNSDNDADYIITYGFEWYENRSPSTIHDQTLYITGNATAVASDVAQGKIFFNGQGLQIGIATGGSPNLQSKTNINPTTSSQTITADSGYDGLSSVQINAMPTGSAGTPSASKGTVSNHSVSVTPSVTNTIGYITGGTKTGTAVTVSASELVSGNKEITANGTGIDVANYSTVSVAVPSSGSSKNVQVAQSTSRATTSTYTSLVSLTCSTTGTYDIYWDCFRSTTGGTSGSQLYIGGSAYDTANTAFTNHAQNNHLTGVSLTANQTVAVYARSRGNNYYAYVGPLVIVQTA